MAASTELSKTLYIISHGGGDNTKVSLVPKEVSGPDDVLLEVKACGLNFAELMARQGLYKLAPRLPAVLGLECSGVVVELGANVSSLKVFYFYNNLSHDTYVIHMIHLTHISI